MPCRSDYLEPTGRESKLRQAAKLLEYTLEQLGRNVPEYVKAAAADVYCKNDRPLTRLCEVLKSLTPDDIDRIVYNPRDRTARELATWWEDHQRADTEREEREAKAARQAAILDGALNKLTEEELTALDVPYQIKGRWKALQM